MWLCAEFQIEKKMEFLIMLSQTHRAGKKEKKIFQPNHIPSLTCKSFGGYFLMIGIECLESYLSGFTFKSSRHVISF